MLQLGQRLGDFEIVRLLGKGGMGEVYEAQQLSPSRRVALKVLAPWLAADDAALERFWREADVPAQLDHPGIVRIISTGKTPDGVAYFTMQLVRGISLAELVRRAKDAPEPRTTAEATPSEPVPSQETPTGAGIPVHLAPPPCGEIPRDVLQEYLRDRYGFIARYGTQAARALAFAHSQGVLHRDIKPSNLMIDHHRHVYIVDFGLTRGFGPNAFGSQVGPVRGTPWYMSPEQARGQTVDQRSDIYSLGVTLYELATLGVGPFTANRDSNDAVLSQVRAGQTLPLRMLAPDIPRALESVIVKAMQFRPNKRFATAGEMGEGLEGTVEKPIHSPSSRHVWRDRRFGRPNWLTIALGAGAALVLFTLVLLAALTNKSPAGGANSVATSATAAMTPVRGADYPATLLNREPRIPVSLLRDDLRPILGHTAMGTGSWSVLNRELVLHSPPSAGPNPTEQGTYLILDDDPNQRWFTYEVALRCRTDGADKHHGAGIFFGMRRAEAGGYGRFFVVKLDQAGQMDGPERNVRIGSSLIRDKQDNEAGRYEPFRSFPMGQADLGIPRVGPWYVFRIQAKAERVSISIDDGAAKEVDLAWLRSTDFDPSVGAGLDPRGALGIWVREGVVFCKAATINETP